MGKKKNHFAMGAATHINYEGKWPPDPKLIAALNEIIELAKKHKPA